MDTNALLHCFAGTLKHDPTIRHNAETRLKEISKTPGFLGACLDIIASGTETSESIKLSASLYFKNKINYGWNASGSSTGTSAFSSSNKNELLSFVVDNDEKPVVKDMLVQTMISCSKNSPHCIRILKSALLTIVGNEYPRHNWDDLLPKSLELISNGDLDLAYIGLLCLSEIFRTYRWKTNDSRQDLEMLIINYFPSLLQYANDSLLSNESNVNDERIGELLRLIIKIYKFVTYHDLPFVLQRDEHFIPWANLFVKIIQLPLPTNFVNKVDKESRSHYSWIKCKKWAYANLFRLFQRYACKSLSGRYDYADFRVMFIEHFLPHFLQVMFQQIELWGNGSLWLSDESLYYILNFIETCSTQKKTWPLIQPHFEIILKYVIFPLLTPNEDTLETFENDPQEYIHRNLELWDNDYSPDLAATSVLITAIGRHPSLTLPPTMEFIVQTLQTNVLNSNTTLEQAVHIESVLKMFSSILDKLLEKKSPYRNDIENLLNTLIFPLFNSSYGFLKARVCDICSKIGDIEFKDPKLIEIIFQGIMTCLNDSSDSYLPINLSASLALQTFISEPYFKETLSGSVVPIMQKLLSLSNEFESDAISGVMQEFVEQFSDQLQPFGVELMNNLVQQFLKLAIDLNDASNIDPATIMNSDDIPDESDKQMAALGILSTIISILLSFENSLDIVKNLEQSFYPAAEFILKNNIEDFYRELSEFFENSTFLLRQVTPITWKVLELIGEANRKDDSMISYYLEDFMLMLNNILSYGGEELRKNGFYLNILFEIYADFSITEDTSLDELNVLFDLSQKLTIALGTQLPDAVREKFLNDSLQAILTEKDILKTNIVFGVTSFNVILANIVSAPALTLKYLQQCNALELFFDIWLNHYLAHYTRTFDIKLSTMALLYLLTQLTEVELTNFSIARILPKLGADLVDLIKRYPKAERELAEKRKEYTSFDNNPESTLHFNDDDDNDGAWDADGDDEVADNEDDLIVQKFLDELKNKDDSGFHNTFSFNDNGSFDDLEEDPLTKSILDDINIYSLVKASLSHMQQADGSKYHAVFGQLTTDQQQCLLQVINS
ncbi:Nmd5p PWA37_002721 [Arxiozyma heterogenica]|uniref:Importin N-terminal domain-containing protein n=1 Tax=Arxiozyma heterogenica TaxID=278026 RepID=A0AAN7WRA5_9SACH|nr:hypothetical protein RI543_002077 [Kazachstania heterogenica]